MGKQAPSHIVTKSNTTDYTVYFITITQRITMPFENKERCALSHQQTISALVEVRIGPDDSKRRSQLAETHLGVKRVQPGHSTGQDRICRTAAQLLTCKMKGIKRRGAGGIQNIC